MGVFREVVTRPSLLLRRGFDAQNFAKQPGYFALFRVTACGFLAVNHCVARQHFKAPAAGRDERNLLDDRYKILQYLGRRTDGSRCVVSLGAVFDAHLILLHSFAPVR